MTNRIQSYVIMCCGFVLFPLSKRRKGFEKEKSVCDVRADLNAAGCSWESISVTNKKLYSNEETRTCKER